MRFRLQQEIDRLAAKCAAEIVAAIRGATLAAILEVTTRGTAPLAPKPPVKKPIKKAAKKSAGKKPAATPVAEPQPANAATGRVWALLDQPVAALNLPAHLRRLVERDYPLAGHVATMNDGLFQLVFVRNQGLVEKRLRAVGLRRNMPDVAIYGWPRKK